MPCACTCTLYFVAHTLTHLRMQNVNAFEDKQKLDFNVQE